MTDARPTIEELADAYLDGALPHEAALAFERDLTERPELAEALGAALSLRALLAALPPASPPPGLEERIVAALPLHRREASGGRPSSLPLLRAALSGASWLLRGPAAALEGGIGGARPAAAGLAQVRWALGSLGAQREVAPAPRRPLWRRVLRGGGSSR